MAQVKLNQAEAIAQAKAALEQLDGKILADVLSDGAQGLSAQAQKEVGKKLTQKATKESKRKEAEAERAKLVKGWHAECAAIMQMKPEELAVYQPKFVKVIRHTLPSIQYIKGKMESVPESWDFGNEPGSVSRSGGSIDKRPVLAERYIFPNNKKGALTYNGKEYRFATKVCEALGIAYGKDSAARVLAQAALDAPKGAKVLSVEYTPTDGDTMSLLERAKAAKKAGLLDARD